MMDSKGSLGLDVPSDFLRSLLATISPTDIRSTRAARFIDWLSKVICVLTLWRLLVNPDRASVLERPTQSSVLGLFGAGFVLFAVSLLLRQPARRELGEERIPLAGGDDDGVLSRTRSASLSAPDRISWARQPLRFTLTAVAIMVRLQAFEAVLRNLQCRITGMEAFVPVFVAIFDRYPKGTSKYAALDSLPVAQQLLRALGPALIVSWANNLVWRVASNPRSTVICPATAGTTRWVVQMQLVGVIADAWILHSVQLILAAIQSRASAPAKRMPLILGMLFMTSSGLIFVIGLMTAILPKYRAILANLNYHYLNNLSWSTFLFITFCLFASHWVATHSSTDLAIFISFAASGLQVWAGWDNASKSPAPELHLPNLPPLLLLLFGTSLYFYTTRHIALFDTNSQNRYYRFGLVLLGAGVIFTALFRGVFGSTDTGFLQTHPIDTLIDKATAVHDHWAEQASRSTTLHEAVETYVQRYGRHPPPGFDKWYAFAVARKAYVIDDFDAINENLQLFWKLEPRALRIRTKYLLQDEHHECAEVKIRGGEATIGTVVGTHRWMVEGIIHMMDPFVKDLPDMDLAFNINDEPRVAIPYETQETLEKLPFEPENAAELKNDWGSGRAESWDIPEGEVMKPLDMKFFSFKRVWRLWGSVACPPDSPAWKTHFWDSTVTCTWCYEPHSFQHFLSNWTLAASPCHQPDIANLHGFYMSPSAFAPTHEVLPIFSQSRAGGFADILYPTAWNYNDKVRLDPSDKFPDDEFEKKENTLFWHGTASEGFSIIGTWRGQVRPRMVHLANNSTMKSSVLLKQDKGYRYSELSTTQFLQHPTMRAANFKTALGFVDIFNRCDNGDCEVQEAALGLGEKTDFQSHWRHRFLLDADGAGFSGRFLPFLQSHSVPFKSAIFREWYDSRLTPWKHFVPVDVRLHSLWSTVAYFAAGFGTEKHNGHNPAKTIAEEGREWAAKVLRKEDMEIYFYRLLLEYGRVMHDDRANLGYVWKSNGH